MYFFLEKNLIISNVKGVFQIFSARGQLAFFPQLTPVSSGVRQGLLNKLFFALLFL